MRIFISFFSCAEDSNNKEAIPCFYESFIKGLKESNNELFVYITRKFGYDYGKAPRKLLDQIKDFNPDIIILFNNAFYEIANEFECPIFVYEVDSPLYYSNKNALKSNIDRYKFIVIQEESKRILVDNFKAPEKNILVAPFFSEIKHENIPLKQNICFIGSKFISTETKSRFSRFMMSNPSFEEIEMFKKLLTVYEKQPFLSDEEIFQKFNVTSEKIKENFVTADIIFNLSDYNRTKTLSCVSDLGIRIYGTERWMTDNYNEPFLILNYDKTPIYSIKHNQDVYNASKIGININHLQATQAFSWRVCDIMASGACLVSEYKPDLEKRFASIGLPLFHNPYEARKLCIKLLKEENLRADIVAASNEIIERKYRFKNTKELIEDFFDISLNGVNSSVKYYAENLLNKSNKPRKLKYKIFMYCYEKLQKKLQRKGYVKKYD